MYYLKSASDKLQNAFVDCSRADFMSAIFLVVSLDIADRENACTCNKRKGGIAFAIPPFRKDTFFLPVTL